MAVNPSLRSSIRRESLVKSACLVKRARNLSIGRKNDYEYVKSHIGQYGKDMMPATPEGRMALMDNYTKPSVEVPVSHDVVFDYRNETGSTPIKGGYLANSDNTSEDIRDVDRYHASLAMNPQFRSRLAGIGTTPDAFASALRSGKLSFYKPYDSDNFGAFNDGGHIYVPGTGHGYSHESGHTIYDSVPGYSDLIKSIMARNGVTYDAEYDQSVDAQNTRGQDGYYHQPAEQAAEFNAIRFRHPSLRPGRGSGENGSFVDLDLMVPDPAAAHAINTYGNLVAGYEASVRNADSRIAKLRAAREADYQRRMDAWKGRSRIMRAITPTPRLSGPGKEEIEIEHDSQSDRFWLERYREQLKRAKRRKINPFEHNNYMKGLPQNYWLDLLNNAKAGPGIRRIYA